MKYEYSPTAGYYGTGGWCCYSVNCYGYRNTYKVFGTEAEAAAYCGVKQ